MSIPYLIFGSLAGGALVWTLAIWMTVEFFTS